MHKSVGAIIRNGDKILLLDRASLPYGFAAPAGHVEPGEDPEDAITREVKEETNLHVIASQILSNEVLNNNLCKRGGKVHEWFVFECSVKGNIRKNEESKSLNWYSVNEIKKLKLEPSWEYWFKKLKII